MSASQARLTTMQVRRIIAGHFKTNVRDERVAASTAEILEALTGEKQATDPVGFMLQGAQEVAMEVKILDDLARGLKINIKRDSDAAAIARNIRLDGRSVDTWLTWYRSDQFRLQSMWSMDIYKVWKMWPQAFDEQPQQAPAPIPEELTEDTSKYVQAPAALRAATYAKLFGS